MKSSFYISVTRKLLEKGWIFVSPSDDKDFYYKNNNVFYDFFLRDAHEDFLRDLLKEEFGIEIDND